MKKLILSAFVLCATLTGYSQSFDVANLRVGGGLYYATEIKNVGLTLNGAYAITDQWAAALSFTHIFEKNYVKWNILDLDGHYVFYQSDNNLNVYGLAGMSISFWKITFPAMNFGYGMTTPEIITTGSNIGMNLGVGANYPLTDNLNLAPELRFTIIEGSYLRIGATLQYMF